jgi:hypothetical protein
MEDDKLRDLLGDNVENLKRQKSTLKSKMEKIKIQIQNFEGLSNTLLK